MHPILWHLEISHYSEKVRWALDFKGIEHERRTPMPGLHRLHALALTRTAHDRLPVVKLPGERPLGDSSAIIAALERYRPEPALHPPEPAARERALALEDLFDEELAPRVRRLIWHHTLTDTDATLDAVMPSAGRVRRGLLRATAGPAKAIVRRDYGVSAAGADEALAGIRAVCERIERERQPSGYLVGDSFTVADLAGAALFTPLICPPERQYPPASSPEPLAELRAELSAREAGRWVTEMFARHRGSSCELRGAA